MHLALVSLDFIFKNLAIALKAKLYLNEANYGRIPKFIKFFVFPLYILYNYCLIKSSSVLIPINTFLRFAKNNITAARKRIFLINFNFFELLLLFLFSISRSYSYFFFFSHSLALPRIFVLFIFILPFKI
jgi:hypothetical protein